MYPVISNVTLFRLTSFFRPDLFLLISFTANELTCGIRTVPLQPEINLIGGKDAQEGEWPWQGVLKVNEIVRCGAVLIHPDWVLTTASCM